MPDLDWQICYQSRVGPQTWIGPFTDQEIAVLAGAPFLGVEALLLLGFEEGDLPMRSALRKVGEVLRRLED